eukprot:974306_1
MLSVDINQFQPHQKTIQSLTKRPTALTMQPTESPSQPPTAYSSLCKSWKLIRFKARGCNNLCINEKDNGQTNLADCDGGSHVQWKLAWSPSPMKFRIKNKDTKLFLIMRRNYKGLFIDEGDYFLIEYKIGWMDQYYIKMRHVDDDTCPQWDGCDDNSLQLVPCSSLSSRNQFNIQALDIDGSDLEPMPQPASFIADNYYNLTWLMISFIAVVFVSWCVLITSKPKENPVKMISLFLFLKMSAWMFVC